MKEDLTEGYGILHEEFHSLYSSPNIFRMIRSRRMRWVHKILIRKLLWHKQENNIEMDLWKNTV
jgi:hypothetical protein